MKLRWLPIAMLIPLFTLGCRGDSKTVTRTEDESPGPPSSVKAYGGKYRVKLAWQAPSSGQASRFGVWWNQGRDSLSVPAEPGTAAASIIIDSLAEDSYAFAVNAFDSAGHASAKVVVQGRAYGEEYAGSLENRPMQRVAYNEAQKTVDITWKDAGTGALASLVRYTDTFGATRTLRVSVSSGSTTLAEYSMGEDSAFTYRTLFLPEPEAIDTFYTTWDSVKVQDLSSYYVTAGPSAEGNIPLFCSDYPQFGGWQSSKVWYSSGRLQYAFDSEYNRIPDYSYAGYHYGEKELPDVPVVKTLGPVSGDNTQRIQDELDAIGNRAPDANGHRGALLLLPGRYDVYGIIRIRHSGVVLRGSGDGTDPSTDTIIFARGDNPHQRTPLILGTGDGSPWSSGSGTNVTDEFVPAGATNLHVENASMFSTGQEVIVTHPSSQAWIDAVDGGGVISDASWSAGSKDIPYIRKITQISGSRLYFDAPVYNHLDRSLTQATVTAVSSRNLISESGIEDLRVDIETAGGEDEDHAWSAIGVIGAEDSWVRNVSTRYFGYAGVYTNGAIRITVKDARATDPVGIRTGARFYNFDVNRYSQLILFTGCHAAGGRHNFISNGVTSASGVVWHRCTTSGDNDSEGHRHWSTGLLFDHITGSDLDLKLINRGDWGTQHGWGAAHSTAWNSEAAFFIQKPPTAQNYGISGMGSVSTNYSWPGPSGYTDIRSSALNPESLYEAQLCDRLENGPALLTGSQ